MPTCFTGRRRPMPENNPVRNTLNSVWGILINSGEGDIDISVTDNARRLLIWGGWLFGLLFVAAMILSGYLCFAYDENNTFAGVLRAREDLVVRFSAFGAGGSVRVEEVLVMEGEMVASGQPLVRYTLGIASPSVLRAPMPGVVESLQVTPMQETGLGSVACRLVGTKAFTFSGKVPESWLSKLSPGHTCRLQFNAFPERPFSGRLETIGAKGDYDAALGYSLFPVSLHVDNPDQSLRIGMSGSGMVP